MQNLSKLELTSSNYYSDEASWHYFSKSLYHEFKQCEAETLARLKGDYKSDRNITALLVGNYVHSYFESKESHERFVEEHKDVMISSRGASKGKLKKDYQIADKVINSLNVEPLFNQVYGAGKKEVIVTGEIKGIKWKGKIDSLNLEEGYFCDLKTAADLNKRIWNTEFRQYQNFIEAYGYYTQIALYKELIKQTFDVDCTPFIFAVSKENVPNKAAIKFNSDEDINTLNYYLTRLEDEQEHMRDVLNGEKEPKHCGKCEYCKSIKHLTDFVNASEIGDY